MTGFVADASLPLLVALCVGFLALQNVVWSAVGMAFERGRAGRERRIWALAVPEGQIRRELWANLRFDVLVGVVLAALLASGAVAIAPAGIAGALATFAVCWVAFEIFYWMLHRALHTRPLYRFHRFHHDSRITTPFTGLSVGTVEALGWALGFAAGPLLLSLFTTVSLEGWALYLVYNSSGNIVGHVNAELMGAAIGRRRNSWLVHPVVYHSLHHARFAGHYGFGSTFMDRLLGTEWGDWAKLHARVRAGRPLGHLAERG